jgi:hypothetical protein
VRRNSINNTNKPVKHVARPPPQSKRLLDQARGQRYPLELVYTDPTVHTLGGR